MKKITILLVCILFNSVVNAQQEETFLKKSNTLVFVNQDPYLNTKVKKGLINTFFKVYPKLVKDFNSEATNSVQVTIDTSYTGVAYAHNGKITISSNWLVKKPEDLDVITHEVMHIVQSYPPNSGPGWLTEGIADYVRFKYGLNNKKAGWALTEYSLKHSYTNSYRITARFLYWITQNYDNNIVKKLDNNMRAATYSSELWNKYTGFSLDELWTTYSKNSKI